MKGTKGTQSEVKTYTRGNNDAPSISKYGSLVQGHQPAYLSGPLFFLPNRGHWHIPTSTPHVPPDLPQNMVLFYLVWALPTESEPLKDITAIAQLQ